MCVCVCNYGVYYLGHQILLYLQCLLLISPCWTSGWFRSLVSDLFTLLHHFFPAKNSLFVSRFVPFLPTYSHSFLSHIPSGVFTLWCCYPFPPQSHALSLPSPLSLTISNLRWYSGEQRLVCASFQTHALGLGRRSSRPWK